MVLRVLKYGARTDQNKAVLSNATSQAFTTSDHLSVTSVWVTSFVSTLIEIL
jgi:hypothetical protein